MTEREINFSDEIHSLLDDITEKLSAMSKEDRIAWFKRSMYLEPLNFTKEIDGTTYAIRTFFKDDAKENITDKVQRIVLKNK